MLSLEYRRVGHDGGGFPGTLDDIERGAALAARAAACNAIDLQRVVVLGHSAGGQVALFLAFALRHATAGQHELWRAARAKLASYGVSPGYPEVAPVLRGVVALAAVSDLALGHALNLGDGIVDTFIGGAPDAVPERYAVASPAQLLPLGAPQVLVHGDADDTVPVAMSVAYADRARAAGDDVTLDVIEGAGHFELIDPRSAAWEHVVNALTNLTT